MSAPTRWWWVRHAPVPEAAGRIYGQEDHACDTSDAGAFRALAGLLPADAVWIVSPLRRTRETADAIAAAGLAVSEPIVEPGLFLPENRCARSRWMLVCWLFQRLRNSLKSAVEVDE